MGKLSKKVSEDDKYTIESLQEIIKITQANIQNRLTVIDDLLKNTKCINTILACKKTYMRQW